MAAEVAAWAAVEIAGAAAGSTFASYTAAQALVYAAAYVATTAAIAYGANAILSSLAKNKGASDLNAGRDIMLRTGVAPKRVIYGRDKVSGPLVFAATSDATPGGSTGAYRTEYITITETTYTTFATSLGEGAQGQVVPYTLNDNLEATFGTPFTGGGATGTGTYAESSGVYTFHSSDIGRNVAITFLIDSGGATIKNWYLHMVIALAAHECDAIEKVYIDDEEIDVATQLDVDGNVTSGRYAVVTAIRRYLGTSTQTADTLLVASVPTKWTTAHRLKDTCYVYVRLQADFNVFTSQPQIRALVRGKKCLDPRTSTTIWTQNPAVCIRDFCMASYGFNADSTRINDTYVIAAANACDETVVKPGGGSHTRYVLDGSFTLDVPPPETLKAMLSSMVGWWTYSGGKIAFGAGVYTAETGPVLTASMLRAPISFPAKMARRELINVIRGRHVSSVKGYKDTDYPPIIVSGYVSADSNVEYPYNLDLPFVQDPERCQRIAKTFLRKLRQQLRVVWKGKLSCYEYKIGQTVRVTISDFGWTNKIFVVDDWRFSFDGGVDLVLREEDPTAYDWVEGDAQHVDANPDTNLPSPFFLPALTSVTLASGTSHLFLNTDGTIVPRIKVSWTRPVQGSVRDGYIDIHYKPTAGTDWSEGVRLPANQEFAYLSGVQSGVAYDVTVRLVNQLGIGGPWYTISNHTVIGETARPSKPSSFAVSVLADGTRQYTWTPISDLDRAGYQLRVGTNTSEWNSAQVLAGSGSYITESVYESNNPPNGTYNFLVAAFDRTGNVSSAAVVNSATLTAAPSVFTDALGLPMYPHGAMNIPPTLTGSYPLIHSTASKLERYNPTYPTSPPHNVQFTNCASDHWLQGRKGYKIRTEAESGTIWKLDFYANNGDPAYEVFRVDENARYSVSLLMAASLCDASLVMQISNGSFQVLSVPGFTTINSYGGGSPSWTQIGSITSAQSKLGGSQTSDYALVGAIFDVPTGGRYLSVGVQKSISLGNISSGSYIEMHDLMIARGHSTQATVTPFVVYDAMYRTVETESVIPNAVTDHYRTALAADVVIVDYVVNSTWTTVLSLGDIYVTHNDATIQCVVDGSGYSWYGSAAHLGAGRIRVFYRYPGSLDTSSIAHANAILWADFNAANTFAQGPFNQRVSLDVESGRYYGFSFEAQISASSGVVTVPTVMDVKVIKR